MDVWEGSLGGCIKALGDGVQTGGGSKGDSPGNDTVGSVRKVSKEVGVSLGVSGPLFIVTKVFVGVRSVSLGGGIKPKVLGDGTL